MAMGWGAPGALGGALILLALLAPARAAVRAVLDDNASTVDFADLPALFGAPVAPEGVRGYRTEAEPADAGRPLEAPRPGANGSPGAFALLRRFACTFDVKVHAQRAGFEAAMGHDVRADALLRAAPAAEARRRPIAVPAVLVGEAASRDLRALARCRRALLLLPARGPRAARAPRRPPPPAARPLGRALGPLAAAAAAAAAWGLRRLWARRRAAREPRAAAPKARPRRRARVRTFTRRHDVCAICLDEYEEGERLAVLPCAHAFHCGCVEPWFSRAARRACPVCARSLAGTEDGSDSTAGSRADEAPALPGRRAPSWAVRAPLRPPRPEPPARAASPVRRPRPPRAPAPSERPPDPP